MTRSGRPPLAGAGLARRRAAARAVLAAMALLTLPGPAAWPAGAEALPPATVCGLRLPATFTGTLPCADCLGIRTHLDLWPTD
ncbi:copper resistance protein NlpE N-terminal domain-containing protein [Rubellimicrobium roseum]|uniref:Copper resistance protein NlpE n=1 Tax=Rubellimicrobium roseum TaxID=687525 RepID=A0A5C4NBW4_9RHOB|nr:copper resistance protein NlpE N-terminal domain-containing protein [Rubellimicrobium roseum]TNC65377.1 copper resistance protein NlpE [Rubellimicrobium roseum]